MRRENAAEAHTAVTALALLSKPRKRTAASAEAGITVRSRDAADESALRVIINVTAAESGGNTAIMRRCT